MTPREPSNYPPGVSGNEPQITGESPWNYVHVPNSEAVWDGASDRAACDPELVRVEVSDSPDGVTCQDCAEVIGLDLDTHNG